MQQLPPQQLPEPSVDNNGSHTDHSHSNSSFRCRDFPAELLALSQPNHVNWRFRVPDKEEGEDISFVDGHIGPQSFRPGESRPAALSLS